MYRCIHIYIYTYNTFNHYDINIKTDLHSHNVYTYLLYVCIYISLFIAFLYKDIK